MATCERESPYRTLDLPVEFEDLAGLVQGDFRALVDALTDRASERLLLTRKETAKLRRTLWNRLTDAVNETLEPLSANCR